MPLRLTSLLTVLLVMVLAPGAILAEPRAPSDPSEVLERLPRTGGSDDRDLRRLRARWAADPTQVAPAVELARRYIVIARAEGDPRYNGYAQAALGPWWDDDFPPYPVLILRATLRQNRHDFTAALADLDLALVRRPGDPQAWLTRAVVLQVQGRYPEAAASCRQVSAPLIAATCSAEIASLSGQATRAYAALLDALERSPATPQVRLWVLTVLAEMAQRRGESAAAEAHFRAALALDRPDSYLLGAYADFLLEQGRADEVLTLIDPAPRQDGLLLRRALAEQAAGAPSLAERIVALEARFAANQRRGDSSHLRDQARFHLHLTGRPTAALTLALENWRVQREPWDALLVLRSALAAGQTNAAQPVLDWLEETGLEERRLERLAAQITAARS